jgi:hypothetical protein
VDNRGTGGRRAGGAAEPGMPLVTSEVSRRLANDVPSVRAVWERLQTVEA